MIAINGKQATGLYVGSRPVLAVYLDGTRVWEPPHGRGPHGYARPPFNVPLFIQLFGNVPDDVDTSYYKAAEIDGFENDAVKFATLNSTGLYTIAYFSAGTCEGWRPDAQGFPESAMGAELPEHPGERWLDVKQIHMLKPIMQARVTLAVAKGAKAISWDHVDAFAHPGTGVTVDEAQQHTYLDMLADITHAAGLAVILKGAVNAQWAWSRFDGCIAEEAHQHDEAEIYGGFYMRQKPVWILHAWTTRTGFSTRRYEPSRPLPGRNT